MRISCSKRGAAMGKYVQESLLKDEKVVFETRYHWIIYFWPIVFLIAAFFTAA